ncbi:hypothetical protein [Nonomuraea jabiensis]|uniref:Glycosyltransferase RgtA/B/C/D-like domain-containing protein n=1 Tax=Nonomuraea jabiensis TaxID=882448 RepID=A0A7W9LDK1_9ACTN|nr:hypothetical protein [Nonomuraea jabiensis]MBB5779683.1 hypothetical protein [Nonomuraea jabiensis]
MTTAFMTPAPVHAPARHTGRARLWWLLAAGWAAHVALRLWLYRYHTGPVANPDETGYLLAARWLAGGPGADLTGSTFYQGGYPLLLVPIFWLTSDPVLAYRLVAGAGSMAAASAYPLAYLLLRRMGLGRRAALITAFVAALSPALVVFSGLALTDAILPVLVLAWLVALHDLVAYRSARAGAVAGALAAFAMATHLRGSVVLAVCVLVVVVVWAGRRAVAPGRGRAAGPVVAALASAAVVAVAGKALNGALGAALYPGGPRDLSGLLVSRLTSLEGQAWALSGAAGQLWYLVAGTWGLAGVGLAGAAATLVRRSAPYAHRVLAGALLLTTLGIAYASSAALPDEHRVGNYVYGRYLACVAVAWTLAGLIVLVKGGRLAVVRHALAAAGLLALTGGVAAWYAGDRLERYAFIAFDFPEVIFLTGENDALDLVAASVPALVLLACLTGAAFLTARRGRLLVVGVLALIDIAFTAGQAPARPSGGPDWLPAPPPGRVAVDRRVKWNIWVPLAYRVSWTRIEFYNGRPPSGACTAVVPYGTAPPPGWAATGLGGAQMGWTTWSNGRCR